MERGDVQKKMKKLKTRNLHDAAVVEKVQRKKKEKVGIVESSEAISTEMPNRKKVELKKKKKVAKEIDDSSLVDDKLNGNLPNKRKEKEEHSQGKKKGKLNKTMNKRKADEISSGPVVDEDDHHLIKQASDDKASSEAVDTDAAANNVNRKSKKSNKRKKTSTTKENKISSEKMNKVEEEEDVYEISSGDEDCSRGMIKWVTDYHESRPGLEELQKRIDDFMTAHEERLEQEKQEREAKAAEGGWTVVVHHKGRKKTTDAESGTAVGSVSQAALEDKVAKKKKTEIVGHGFYRFQRRDAQRSELLALQTKFEEDKKRIQQIRAARKFKPY